MPDNLALTMKADVLPSREGPALSATSDMPRVEIAEPTAPPAEPEKGETPDTAPSDAKSDDSGPVTATDDAGKDKTPPQVKAEITKERNRRRAAETERDRLQTDLQTALDALKTFTAKAEPVAKQDGPTPKPVRESFADPDAYESAITQWAADNATRETEARIRKEAEEKTRTEQTETLRKTWTDKRAKALEKYPDYVEVAESPDVKISPAMANVIVHADNGEELAYHLGKNPDVAERIAALPPVMAVFELGRIADNLAKKPDVTTAPPPVKPLGNRAASVEKSPEEMSMEEYAARRMPQLRAENSRFFGGRPKPN